jgi:probable HAF family extracellular repeat protein
MSDLGKPDGGTFSAGLGINDAGKVVGFAWSSENPSTHAFLYSDGVWSDLGSLGGSQSVAKDINSTDKVVGGSYTSGDAAFHAFLYSDGVMSDLNSLIPANSGWELFAASGINDKGHIVGDGIKDGQWHAFLLTPFDGFYQPVDNLPTLNKTKAGKTYP